MPLYDYKCNNCDHIEEIVVKYKDSESVFYCSECDSILEKQLSAPVVRMGGGIHSHDASTKDWGELND